MYRFQCHRTARGMSLRRGRTARTLPAGPWKLESKTTEECTWRGDPKNGNGRNGVA